MTKKARGGPKRGDRLVIHWPGGLDFDMYFLNFTEGWGVSEALAEWRYLYGIVGYEPGNSWFPPHPIYRTLFARPLGNGEWEMLPKLL